MHKPFRRARHYDIHTKRLIFEHANAIDLNDILITPEQDLHKILFSPKWMNGATASLQPLTTTTEKCTHTVHRGIGTEWIKNRQQMRKVSHLFCLFFNCSTCMRFFSSSDWRILCPMICEKVKKQFCKLLVLTILCILLCCRRIVVTLFHFPYALTIHILSLLFPLSFTHSHASMYIVIPFFDVVDFTRRFFFCSIRRKAKCMLQRDKHWKCWQQQSNRMPEN